MNENYFMGQDGFAWFVGVVEDRDDPDKLGRVRVRCLGYHTEDLRYQLKLCHGQKLCTRLRIHQ